jgi:hypothetical protein
MNIKEQLEDALNYYETAYSYIQNLQIKESYELLIKLRMNYGFCHYFNYNNEILDFLLKDLSKHKHLWRTPSKYYYKKMHPKLALPQRIRFLKTKIKQLQDEE